MRISKYIIKIVLIMILYCSLMALLMGCSNNETSTDIESWIGGYVFSEYYPPDQNMFYSITIYKENSDIYAQISLFGFQTNHELIAHVKGNKNAIDFIMDEYLPDNRFETYQEGDILLSFEKKDGELYTTWGAIQPMLDRNQKPGVYFWRGEKAE